MLRDLRGGRDRDAPLQADGLVLDADCFVQNDVNPGYRCPREMVAAFSSLTDPTSASSYQVYPDRPRLDRDHAGLHDGG